MSAPGRPAAARVLAPLALMALIFVLSAQASHDPDRAWWDIALRKLAHFSEYAALTALWWWALLGRARRPLAAAAAIALLWAIGDEYHQTFVEGRQGTVRDAVIDAAGIALACLLVRRRTRSRSRAALPAGRPEPGGWRVG